MVATMTKKLVIFSKSKHLAFYHHPKKIAVQQQAATIDSSWRFE